MLLNNFRRSLIFKFYFQRLVDYEGDSDEEEDDDDSDSPAVKKAKVA